MYCGNNRHDLGVQQRGTPYTCLRKGIGQGLVADLAHFNPNYDPIIPDNTYCGTKSPPEGKIWGTPTSCLRKGFGIGQMLQYERAEPFQDTGDGQPEGQPATSLKILLVAFFIFMALFLTFIHKDVWLMMFIFILVVTLWIVL